MEERVWKMIMTKKDSNALALKNIKGNIVKVQNVIYMMVIQTQWRVNFLRQVNFMCARVNRIEAIYKGSRENVKVEKGSTCMFTRELSYIASTLINARKDWPACTRKKSAIVEIHLKGFFFTPTWQLQKTKAHPASRILSRLRCGYNLLPWDEKMLYLV